MKVIVILCSLLGDFDFLEPQRIYLFIIFFSGYFDPFRLATETICVLQSDEDLALKQQLELYVERVQDPDPGLQKVALESMR